MEISTPPAARNKPVTIMVPPSPVAESVRVVIRWSPHSSLEFPTHEESAGGVRLEDSQALRRPTHDPLKLRAMKCMRQIRPTRVFKLVHKHPKMNKNRRRCSLRCQYDVLQ